MFKRFASERLHYQPYTLKFRSELDHFLAVPDIAGALHTPDPLDEAYLSFFAPTEPTAEKALMLIRHNQQIIGALNFGGISPWLQFGYWLMPEARGKGYAREAVGAFIRHAKGLPGIYRLQAQVEPRNTSSCQLLEASGFFQEGLLKSYRLSKRTHKVFDVLMYALIFSPEQI